MLLTFTMCELQVCSCCLGIHENIPALVVKTHQCLMCQLVTNIFQTHLMPQVTEGHASHARTALPVWWAAKVAADRCQASLMFTTELFSPCSAAVIGGSLLLMNNVWQWEMTCRCKFGPKIIPWFQMMSAEGEKELNNKQTSIISQGNNSGYRPQQGRRGLMQWQTVQSAPADWLQVHIWQKSEPTSPFTWKEMQ